MGRRSCGTIEPCAKYGVSVRTGVWDSGLSSLVVFMIPVLTSDPGQTDTGANRLLALRTMRVHKHLKPYKHGVLYNMAYAMPWRTLQQASSS